MKLNYRAQTEQRLRQTITADAEARGRFVGREEAADVWEQQANYAFDERDAAMERVTVLTREVERLNTLPVPPKGMQL